MKGGLTLHDVDRLIYLLNVLGWALPNGQEERVKVRAVELHRWARLVEARLSSAGGRLLSHDTDRLIAVRNALGVALADAHNGGYAMVRVSELRRCRALVNAVLRSNRARQADAAHERRVQRARRTARGGSGSSTRARGRQRSA